MSAAAGTAVQVASPWRVARRLYPIYRTLAAQFQITALSPELEHPIDRPEPEIMDKVEAWFGHMDQEVKVWQIRQLLQSTHLATEENLRLLILRNLTPNAKIHDGRNKIDFLLVQYFAHCAPHGLHKQEITIADVAAVLAPVLGPTGADLPEWALEFNNILKELDRCRSLGDMLRSALLQRARILKQGIPAQDYFLSGSLVAIARFNFLMRLGFFRLMHIDLHVIRETLHELETRGVPEVDCTRADLGPHESLSSIRAICHEWTKPFRASYLLGNSFRQIVDIRAALEFALSAVASEPHAALQQMDLTVQEPSKIETLESTMGDAKALAASCSSAELDSESGSVQTGQEQIAENSKDRTTQPLAEVATNGEEDWPTPVRPQPGLPSLAHCSELIAQALSLALPKGAGISKVIVEETKAVLTPWEVAAFRANDEISLWLRRAVSCRVLLAMALEKYKKSEAHDLPQALSLVDGERKEIQLRIEQAKAHKHIDSAANLAATNKKLVSMIEEARKLLA